MIIPHILTNPIVLGSLGLSLGSLLGFARQLPRSIWNLFERLFTCSIQVSNMEHENTFDLVKQWIGSLDYAKNTRNLTAVLDGKWILTPSPGSHFFLFENRPTWLYRSRKDPASDTRTQTLKYQESITIRMLTRNKEVLSHLCEKITVYGKSIKIPDGYIQIFCIDYNSWYSKGLRMGRSLNSVILPKGEMERIINDLDFFFNNKDWYKELGIPYRRGWLLQGVPGSGKTSLVSAIASHFKRRIYIMNLTEPELTDSKLLSLFGSVSKGSIILLEDIDAAFSKRESKDGITFSGLLNALDGVASPEGAVVFMTTNHPELLDPALIRPGRIDHVMNFTLASEEQLLRMFYRFYPDSDPSEFIVKCSGNTIAQAQIYLLGLFKEKNALIYPGVNSRLFCS